MDHKGYKKVNKNSPKNIDINKVAFQYFDGVDLMSIEGVSHSTVLSIMSEIGQLDLKNLPAESNSPPGFVWLPIIKYQEEES